MPDQKPRVVVADDNQTNQIVLSHVLKSGGFSPVIVSSGDSVLNEIAGDAKVDAVVIDICMPEISGLDTIKLIRFSEVGDRTQARLPIVALTADDQRKTRDECISAGADAFLVQPVTSSHLISTIRLLISEREDSDETSMGLISTAESLRAPGYDPLGPVKIEVIDDLKSIGGMPFVLTLVDSFKTDVEVNLSYLKDAVEKADIKSFQERVMGIFSSSATLGGIGIKTIYDHAMTIPERHFSRIAPLIVARLQFEVRRLITAIEKHVGLRDRTSQDSP